jgi:hypothetical protein
LCALGRLVRALGRCACVKLDRLKGLVARECRPNMVPCQLTLSPGSRLASGNPWRFARFFRMEYSQSLARYAPFWRRWRAFDGIRSPPRFGEWAPVGSVDGWLIATVHARIAGEGSDRYPPPGVTREGYPPLEGHMQRYRAARRARMSPRRTVLWETQWGQSNGLGLILAPRVGMLPRPGALRRAPSL